MNRSITLILLLLVAGFASAQPAQQLVQVQVSPARGTFIYQVGDDVTFDIAILKNSVPVASVEVQYTVSEDMMAPHKSETITLKNGTATIKAGTMKKPGFLRCQVTAKYQGRTYKGLSTVGFEPEKIEAVTQLPDDFTAFWDKAKAEAARVPMDVKMTLAPEKCTDKLNVYNVNIQSYRHNSRLHGVLCVPKGGAKYPAILKVPGAGVRAYYGDMDSANRGFIVFEIGIHGIPVNLPGEVYRDLYEGPLKNYHSSNLDNRDEYYYKRVYMGCVRAIDFIFTLPEFDGENLIAYGGSQGGALSIVTAALDSRVKALVSYYPALCDVTGYLHNRAGGWPHMFRNVANNTPDKIRTAQYYDVVNFARHIKVPGFYTFGYNDMVCPPTTVYSAVNAVKGPKEIFVAEDTGHYAYPEQRNAGWEWLKEVLGK